MMLADIVGTYLASLPLFGGFAEHDPGIRQIVVSCSTSIVVCVLFQARMVSAPVEITSLMEESASARNEVHGCPAAYEWTDWPHEAQPRCSTAADISPAADRAAEGISRRAQPSRLNRNQENTISLTAYFMNNAHQNRRGRLPPVERDQLRGEVSAGTAGAVSTLLSAPSVTDRSIWADCDTRTIASLVVCCCQTLGLTVAVEPAVRL
jgi:hypothetical protein